MQEFWLSFHSWLQSKVILMQPLNVMSIKTGVLMKEKKWDFLVNNLILLGKTLFIDVNI